MIASQLREIGVLPGMSLEIHSSYKQMNIGISPEEIIGEIENYITCEGTIVMSSFPLSKGIELTESDKKNGYFF